MEEIAMVEIAIDPRRAWDGYQPSDASPWDLRKVGHLYRRAAFGVTHAEAQVALKDGPTKTIDNLLAGAAGHEEFDRQTSLIPKSAARANNGNQAREWWLYRMLYGKHPLREKLTLFWHNHFATSNAKVNNAGYMLGQYDLMRRHALGNFRALLQDMSKDPAMLVWLDTNLSKKAMPNENYARELMELFSLGIGNYTEADIREAARAFTGWSIEEGKGAFKSANHDDTPKTVFGKTGKYQGSDIVNLCLDKPSSAIFICTKLFRFLISETIEPTRELLEPLAEDFRKSDYDFGALVSRVLRSNLFFSAEAYRTRVKSPVDFMLGIAWALEAHEVDPKPDRKRTSLKMSSLASVLESLGQNLFYPPSVKGWDGGRAWLNGQTLLYRQNLALAMTATTDPRFGRSADPVWVVEKHGQKPGPELVDFFLKLFLDGDVPAEAKANLLQYEEKSRTQRIPVYWTERDAADHRVRALCHLALTLPEYQLS
jgi:uncharacterized protein (DUF1800 family)